MQLFAHLCFTYQTVSHYEECNNLTQDKDPNTDSQEGTTKHFLMYDLISVCDGTTR